VIQLVNGGYLATWADFHVTALIGQLFAAIVLFVLMWECDPWFYVATQGLLIVKPDQGYADVSTQFGFDFNGWTVQTSLMGNKASMFCVAPIVTDSWLPLNETNPTKLNFWTGCEISGDTTCADLLNSDDEPDCMKLWKNSNIGGVQIAGKDYWAYVQSAELHHGLPVHDPVLDDTPVLVQWESPHVLQQYAQNVLIGMMVSFDGLFLAWLIGRPFVYKRWKFLWLMPKGFAVPVNTPNVAGGTLNSG